MRRSYLRQSDATSAWGKTAASRVSTHMPVEIDAGDQFIDAASQSFTQRQFALDAEQARQRNCARSDSIALSMSVARSFIPDAGAH
jgi:NAD-dependent oxidoreductase involved in siderophore biosynthesis